MRILVTSGSGLMGNAFRKLATTKYASHEFFFHIRSNGDLSDLGVFNFLLKGVEPDIIIHNASMLHGSFATQSRIAESKLTNTKVFENLLKGIRSHQQVYCLSSYHVITAIAPFFSLDLEALNWDTSYAQEKSRQINRALSIPNINFMIMPHLFGEYDNFSPGRAHFVANSIRRVVTAKERQDTQIEFFGSTNRLLQFSTSEIAAEFILATIFSDIKLDQRYFMANVGWVRTCQEMFERICATVGFNGVVTLKNSDKADFERDMYFSTRSNHYNMDEPELMRGLKLAVDYFKRYGDEHVV